MNFKELETIIEALRVIDMSSLDELRVCIPIQVVGVVGGTPYIDVKRIDCGFDWDKGKLMIIPEKLLREIDRDEIAEIRKKYDELGSMLSENRSLKRENKKLRDELLKQLNTR